MSKLKPILFSTPMVQAIIEGRKTQTRRVIKSKHESGLFRVVKNKQGEVMEITSLDWDERPKNDCTCDIQPKYKVGDILWVKETFRVIDRWEDDHVVQLLFKDGTNTCGNLAEDEWSKFTKWSYDKRMGQVDVSSLFMFKSMSRIFLQVTDVQVERLQDITREDAIAEGILLQDHPCPLYKDYRIDKFCTNPLDSFKSLWESINGRESWETNPWVWVYSFERTEKPTS